MKQPFIEAWKMDDIDMTQISAIEDLGDFLSNQLSSDASVDWKGFELDYADDSDFLDFPQNKHAFPLTALKVPDLQHQPNTSGSTSVEAKQYNGESSFSSGSYYKHP